MDDATPRTRLATGYGRSNPPADQALRLQQLAEACEGLIADGRWPSLTVAALQSGIPTTTLGQPPFRAVRHTACENFCLRYPDHPQTLRAQARGSKAVSSEDVGEVNNDLSEIERLRRQLREFASAVRERDQRIERLRIKVANFERILAAEQQPPHEPRQRIQ